MNLQAATNKLHILQILMQHIHLCIPLQYIIKVFPLMELKEIPGTPPYCAGLMNVRGESIPVIDLALRLHVN